MGVGLQNRDLGFMLAHACKISLSSSGCMDFGPRFRWQTGWDFGLALGFNVWGPLCLPIGCCESTALYIHAISMPADRCSCCTKCLVNAKT